MNFDGFGVHLVSVNGYFLWEDVEKLKSTMYVHKTQFFTKGKGDYTFSVTEDLKLEHKK